MQTLDPAQVAILGTASIAITQIIRDLGLQGDWLKLVCIVTSSILGYIMIFQPSLWSAIVVPLVGAIGTGGVSFVKEMASSSGSVPSGD